MPNNLSEEFAAFVGRPFGQSAQPDISSLVTQAAAKYQLDPQLLHSMIRQESGGNPTARSPKGAQGLMQLMPATAAELGVKDPFDPVQNIDGGARYMSQLMKRYGGDTNKALMAYNAGMGNVDSGRAASFPETQGYVRNITGNLNAQSQTPASATSPLSQEFAEFIASGAKAETPAKPAVAPVEERTWTDTAVDALPAIGGTVGGILGAIPGTVFGMGVGGVATGMGGAALGGGAGEAARQLINRYRGKDTPEDSLAAAQRIVGQGAKEGVTDLVGGAVARTVFKPLAQTITKAAFKPTEEALKASPTLVDDILEQGIPLSRKGVAKAQNWTGEARQFADEAIEQFKQANPTDRVGRDDVLNATLQKAHPEHIPVYDEILKGTRQTPKLEKLSNYLDDAVKDNPAQLSIDRTREIQRSAGSNAKQIFEGADAALESRIEADIHTGAASQLHKRVPGLKELDAETRRRTKVLETVFDAVNKNAAKGHVPSAADQFLAWQGLSRGMPGMLALAGLREVGKVPRVQAAVGRGFNQLVTKNAPAQAVRAAEQVYGEFQKTNDQRRKKAEIDSLFKKYNAQHGQ